VFDEAELSLISLPGGGNDRHSLARSFFLKPITNPQETSGGTFIN